MRWWQVLLVVAYHVVVLYAFGSHIKGSPLV